jgi:hypothetical protein
MFLAQGREVPCKLTGSEPQDAMGIPDRLGGQA